MTLAEKILAAHTDKKEVSPGEFLNVRVDLILANDITAPIAIREFRRTGVARVFDPGKIVMSRTTLRLIRTLLRQSR